MRIDVDNVVITDHALQRFKSRLWMMYAHPECQVAKNDFVTQANVRRVNASDGEAKSLLVELLRRASKVQGLSEIERVRERKHARKCGHTGTRHRLRPLDFITVRAHGVTTLKTVEITGGDRSLNIVGAAA